MLNAPQLVVRLLKRDLGFVWNVGSRPRCSSSGTVDHAVDHSTNMSCPVGLEASVAKPEIDELDGFRFVAFERADEMDYYVKQTAQQRRPTPRHRRNTSLKKTAGGAKAARNGALPASRAKPKANSKVVKGATQGKKKSILWRHKKRLRKNDKRVVFDKIQNFVFMSAFTLDDFDNFEQKISEQISPLDGPIKRKSTSPPPITPSGAKKIKKNIPNLTLTEFGKTPSRGGVGTTSTGPAKPTGENFTTHPGNFPTKNSGNIGPKHSGKSAPRYSGKVPLKYSGKIASPLSKSELGRLKRLNPPVLDGRYVKGAVHATTVSRNGASLPQKKRKRFPHMQIDNPIQGGTIYSSSDTDGSTIVISDSEENTYLDVCTIDNDSSSAQFIKNSIQNPEERQGGADIPITVKKPTYGHDSKGKSKRRKKCKMCCANPCRIVEAKKVSPLWGSVFPSYNVSCITTCKLHPPGEIIVSPSSAREGLIDTCIQTTASDIKMHQNFAQRFPHQAIAVTSHPARDLHATEPKIKPSKEYAKRPKSKSEHHRTSEKKRRGQLHDSFSELRKVINTSQATPDNERASKQWILEHATKLIASLNADDILLTAMKKTLEAKNAKLRERWKELSGKDFDQSVERKTPSDGQRKLMNLYKKYRHNVVQERFSETNPKLSKVTKSGQAENRVSPSVAMTKTRYTGLVKPVNKPSPDEVPGEQSQSTSVKKWVPFSNSGVTTTSNTRPITFGLSNMKKPSEGVAASRFNQPPSISNASVPTTASKPHQLGSEPFQVTPSYKTSQAVSANTGNRSQTIPMKITNQLTSVSVSSQPVAIALNNPNQSDPPTGTALNIPLHGRGISLKIPRTAGGMDMVSRILAVKKPRQVTTVNLSGQVIKVGQASNLGDLTKQGPATAISKPTQWTSAGKFAVQPPIVNRVPHVDDLGAIVEVGECDGNLDENNTIVLLDVAETKDKQASAGQEQRTLSRIPTSSSINVTLKSVGSITSNKIFNKKPVPSKPPTTVQIYKEATIKTVPESGGSIQQMEATPSKSSTETIDEVPKISDTLLAETFEIGEDAAAASANGPGLCIISNVFSLSDTASDKTYQNEHTSSVLNDTLKFLPYITDVSGSTKCNNPFNGESKETCVNKLAMHDHNYFSYQFILPKK